MLLAWKNPDNTVTVRICRQVNTNFMVGLGKSDYWDYCCDRETLRGAIDKLMDNEREYEESQAQLPLASDSE